MHTKESFAALLSGRQYGSEITKEEEKQAEEAGLVVVYGASDDLCELRGVVYDEIDCGDGGQFLIDEKGLIEKPIQDDLDEEDFEEQFAEYLERKKRSEKIVIKWGEKGYSWTYKTDIPHATFEILEDGEKYCRGIVFSVNDLK